MEENTQNLNQSAPSPVPNTAPGQNPIPQPQNYKPKFRIPIIVIAVIILSLVLIGSASAAYLLVSDTTQVTQESTETNINGSITPTPTPDPIIGWETYENTVYGFSFKYPPEYNLLEDQRYSVDGTTVQTPNTITIVSDMQLSIHYERGSPLTNEQFAISENIPVAADSYTLGGVNGYIYKDSPTGPYGETLIYISYNDTNYVIRIEGNGVYEDFEPMLDQILSTFEFTEVVSIDTSGWKIYENLEYGYSLMHPPTWTVSESSQTTILYPPGAQEIDLVENDNHEISGDHPRVEISVYDAPFEPPDEYAHNITTPTIANRQGYRYLMAPGGGYPSDIITLPYENKQKTFYIFRQSIPQSEIDYYKQAHNIDAEDASNDIFGGILSTLEFR